MIIGIDASRAFVKDKTGTENYSYELIREILRLPESKKHRFRLYVRGIHEGYEPSCGNVEVVEIGWKRLWTQGGLALECLRRPPEVLWIPAHTMPVVRRPDLRTVVTIHGLEHEYLPEFNKFPQSLYLNKSTEYAVRRADKIIAVSEWTKSQLVDRLGANGKKISVTYEGIGGSFLKYKGSSQDRGRVRRKYRLPREYVLFVGTIQPRKNLVRLIEAYSEVVKASMRALSLVIVGKEGWMAEEIYEAPKRYGVEERVKFAGRVSDEDLPAVYQMASLFVWPSLMEGFGLPVLEAMQMGVPVITSDRGALPEVGGKAALQIDPEDVQELAKAIKLVLESRELREGLVEKGYKQVKKFSWQQAARETLKVLSDW